MVEQMNAWGLLNGVYREVRKMSPALVTDYFGNPPAKLGDTVWMVDGKLVAVDRELLVQGADQGIVVKRIVDALRPEFGFMSNRSHFVAQVEVDYDHHTFGARAHVIWGVA